MSEAEEIQAAIDKLTNLSDGRGYEIIHGWLVEGVPSNRSPHHPEPSPLTDDVYVVTLHRTCDAQLAVLRDAGGPLRAGGYLWDYAVNLARAINGEPVRETK